MRHGRSWLVASLVILAGWTVWSVAQPPTNKPAPAVEPDEESEEDIKARNVAAAFKKAVENNPRRGTALDRLYGYHVERGSLDKFVEEYAERAKKDPKDGVAWMIVGLVESQRSRDGAAVVAFQKAEDTLPDNPMASYYLGQCLVLIGRPDAASDAFERAISRKPNRNDMLDAYQALGRVFQRAQKTEKALEVWNRLEKQFPDDIRVQEQIATTLVEEGQYEQALPRLEKLVKGTDDKYRQATLRMEVADLKVKLKKSTDALLDFEKLLNELNPESWLYRDVRRRIEDVFLRNDDLAGLAKYYEKWLEKNTTDVEAIARLAKNLSAQGKGPEARKWLEKGIEVAPSNRSLRQSLIELLAFESNFADAAKQYEAMEKADPGNPDILRDWGKLLMRDTSKPEAERKAAAAAIWKRIGEKKQNDPVVVSQVADLLRTAGITDEAIALYKKAIELAPNAAQYREYLGEYYHSLKRSEDALATWRPIAEGPNRNAKNLARLGEVFAGFGYRKEAIKVFAEATQLEKDDYNLIMQFADVLAQEGEHDEAVKQLDLAAKFTSNAEEVEQVLAARIKVYQATEKLPEQIDALSKELAANPAATGYQWLVLARYFEANRQLDKAVETITKAAEKDAKSLAVLVAAARIHEAGGNMLAAADANRKLANLDRRYRTEYLQQVAALEQRLGRRAEAMQAAKDVLASSPGNPEVYKWYSEMCFQLGDADEGLEALRRSVRANPADPQGLVTLAIALVERVRPGEAIELLWRAFEKTNDLEGKLGIVDRLANLYLEQNQFDKLMERLERERREQEKNRELTMCIAQAYQTAGDLGAARVQLERLLTENTRDTNLLGQLSQLSEQEGDAQAALKYQRQFAAAAPQNFDAQVRLAQLLLKAGEGDEAADVWVKSVAEMNEPHRNLQAIDTLVTSKKEDTALAILSRMLAQKPGNWELLYREAAILAGRGKKDDAAARFKAILALKLPDDELGEVLLNEVKLAGKKKDDKKGTKPTGPLTVSMPGRPNRALDVTRPPLQRRMENVWTIRTACGIDNREYYGGQQQPQFYAPKDFGEARMAALGWLYELSRDQADGQDKFVSAMKKAKDKPNAAARDLWDWHYLQSVRYDNKDTFDRATKLAKASDDPAARFVFLTSVGMRVEGQPYRRYNRGGQPAEDKTPPLPDDQLKYLMETYKKLKQIKPEWVTSDVTGAVVLELKRAKKTDEEKALYQELIDGAKTIDRVVAALGTAVQRDDLETALMLYKKLETLQGPIKSSNMLASLPTRQNYYSLIGLMGKRTEAKKYADGLAVLDYYLGMARKQNIAAPKASASSRRRSSAGAYGINIYSGGVYGGQNRQLTFPSPNEYYDQGMIEVLYNAFELYKKADLTSDLFAHFKKQIAATEGTERLYVHLALGYLHWWNEEKDEALAQLSDATQVGPNDHNLTMEIAGLREQNNEIAEALALVDSVNPTDHQVMQRREETALRLAERTGNIERARQAAERLFGLRLDADKQLELAGKMHRLGMHELAETVLARAQRQAGNKTATLLRLMNQYQTQGQTDQAVQIAKQILRKAPAAAPSRYRGSDENDGTRNQAIGILARSGQLKELVERAEAQLKSSPKSIQIHQTLLGYYQASGDKDKQKATLLKLVELKPDDAPLKMQVAQQMQQQGDKETAMKFYKEAIKKDPTLFQNRYWEIQQLFSQNDKFEELVTLFDEIDLKKFSNYWTVIEMVSPLLQQDKTKELGLRLFKKTWEAFPQERAYILGNLYDDAIWKMPELYGFVKQAVIPKEDSVMDEWSAISQISSYGQNGQVTTVVSRLLSVARKQGRMPELRKEIEAALKKKPDWNAGKALLAVIDIQSGNKAKGIAAWNALFNDPKLDIPPTARFTLAQELEYYAGIEADVVKSLEGGYEEMIKEQNTEYSYSPARRLMWWYEQVGRTDDAKKLLDKAAKADKPNPGYYGGGYWEYRQIQDGLALAQDYARIGATVEAVRHYQLLMSDKDRLVIANSYYGGGDQFTQQIEAGLKETLKKLKPDVLPVVVSTLLTPTGTPETNKAAIDLMLAIDARSLDKTTLTSVFVTAAQSLAKDPAARKAALAKAAEAGQKHPKDFSVAVAAAVVAFTDDNPDTAKAAVERLAKLVDELPLEPLPKGAKANSRQRAEAMLQVPLWLAARECLKRDALRAAGEKIAARAVAAATRQADAKHAVAMLREWGQIELDRKDAAKAEAKWGEMLDLVLPKPAPAKAAQAPAPGATPAPAPAAVPATRAPPPMKEPQARFDDGRPTYFAQVVLSRPAAPASKSTTPLTPKNGVPVLTTDQFQQAYDVAALAADKKLTALSLRAMRDAVKGGPPVEGKDEQNRRGGGSYQQISVGGVSYLVERGVQGPISVDTALINMVAKWKKLGVPAAEMYDVLATAVFPDSRPAEMFLTADVRRGGQVYTLNGNSWTPITNPPPEVYGGTSDRGLAGTLAQLAIDAGRLDDLKKKLESRAKQPLGEMAATVMLFTLAIKANDDPAATEILKKLGERATKDTSQLTLDTVSKLGQMALERPSLAATAEPILQKVAMNYALAKNTSAAADIGEKIIGYHVRAGNKKQAVALLKTMETMAKTFVTPDASYHERVANWYLRSDAVEEALKNFAQHADMMSSAGADPGRRARRQEPTLGNFITLVKLLLEMPADKRYAALKTWTYPAAGRKAIRYYVGAMPKQLPPAAFLKLPGVQANELVSTMLLFADAAKECGKIDELLAEADKLAKDKVENADLFRVLAYLRVGKGKQIEADVKGYKDAAIKRMNDKREADPLRSRYDYDDRQAVPFHASEFLFAQLCLTDPAFTSVAGDLYKPMHDRAYGTNNQDAMGRVREAWAKFSLKVHNTPTALDDPMPARWVSLSPGNTWFAQNGAVTNAWTDENAYLTFDTPLAGTFEFGADVYLGGWKESHGGYAGVVYEPCGDNVTTQLFPVMRADDRVYKQKMKGMKTEAFNRMTIRVTPKLVTVLWNGEVFYEDADPEAISPWLMLYGSNGRKPLFRNPTLTGTPEVLGEVKLTSGDDLRGWFPHYAGERLPQTLVKREQERGGKQLDQYGREQEVAPPQQEPNYDWRAKDGELLGRKLDEPAAKARQSKLGYFRPMRPGDSIRYEFYHEGGKSHVHPSLGRFAFLLDADGVKLHWLTESTEDWTTLPPDNAIPAGDKKLALKEKDWNAVTVATTADTVTITLNGEQVYSGPTAAAGKPTFGFFHYRDRTAARVRNVVLTGDWPKKLASLDDVTFDTKPPSVEVAKTRRHEVGERYFAGDPAEVLKRAKALPPEERFKLLAAWVIPTANQPRFQVNGVSVPRDVLGVVDQKDQPAGRRVMLGNRFEAPSLLLVATAKELDKLDELEKLVTTATSPYVDETFKLNQTAMLRLIAIAKGADAERHVKEATADALKMKPDEKVENRWADLIVAFAAAETPGLAKAAFELADAMNKNIQKSILENKPFEPRDVWMRYYRQVRAIAAVAMAPDGSRRFGSDEHLAHWAAVSNFDSWSRSQGFGAAHWTIKDKSILHHPGHGEDYLFLKTPLAGNFEVTCELRNQGWTEAHVRYGGYQFDLNHDYKSYRMHTAIRHDGQPTTILPPMKPAEKNVYAFKMVVKDGVMTCFVGDRKLHEERIGANTDPWLVLHGFHQVTGDVMNLKITGSPTVPEKIDLMAGEGLPLWRPYLGQIWGKRGEEVFHVGQQPDPRPDGKPEVRTFPENAIYYQRPLVEDGSVEYEFYHDPGKAMVYPMLDRLVVMLEPDGAKLHWLTDSWHDKSGVKFDNLTPTGGAKVPLKDKQWNKGKLSVVGDRVKLEVNGTPVFERDIEPTNQRTFGFFHYADRTEARVRNVYLTGEWAKKLPTNDQLFELKK
jgi:tetratricopeptide (TPR) repeat protein